MNQLISVNVQKQKHLTIPSDDRQMTIADITNLKSMASQGYDDELKPDAEANRIISDADLINIDIKELNKMLKERNVSKELAVRKTETKYDALSGNCYSRHQCQESFL